LVRAGLALSVFAGSLEALLVVVEAWLEVEEDMVLIYYYWERF